MGPDAMILDFWMLSFKLTFPLSSFTFLRRLFSSSSLSAIRALLSAYLRLLIFLLAILIPACASFNLAFHMMYSAYKLNKQGDNIQPSCTPFLIWNQSIAPCIVLTVASWPAYRFLRRQKSSWILSIKSNSCNTQQIHIKHLLWIRHYASLFKYEDEKKWPLSSFMVSENLFNLETIFKRKRTDKTIIYMIKHLMEIHKMYHETLGGSSPGGNPEVFTL